MIIMLAALGLIAGALLPAAIRRIPDRIPAEGELTPTPYRDLAAGSWLPYLFAFATAVVWALLGVARSDHADDLPAYLVVGALGVGMAYVDLREHRLPDWMTLPAFVAAVVLLTGTAAVDGNWSGYGRAWAGAGLSLVFYLVLAVLRPTDLGLGDVKLSAVLGLLLGWVSWSAVLLGIFLGFLVGGVVGIVLLLAGRGSRRSAIPFGPPMMVGALLALLWADAFLDLA